MNTAETKPPRLLLPEPFGRLKHVQKLRCLFLENGWEVKKVSIGEKTYHENAVLILPDTKGINATISYFQSGGTFTVPNIPPQDQAIEHFRLHQLQYFVHRKIGVLGLGTSAFLIFAEVLRGNLQYGRDGLWYGDSKTKLLDPPGSDSQGRFFHDKPLAAGLAEYKYNEDLVLFAEKLLPKKGGGELVKITVPNPQPSPKGGDLREKW